MPTEIVAVVLAIAITVATSLPLGWYMARDQMHRQVGVPDTTCVQ